MMKKGLTTNGWDVMCNISKVIIDIDARCGHLYLPAMNVPDMKSTINCFTSADPECGVIYTYVDGVPDIAYFLTTDGWVAK
jgi:hypothetical protein